MKILTIVALIQLSACVNIRGNYCDVAERPIIPDNLELLTDETVDRLFLQAEKWDRLCS
jgi:hypothetical protein